MADYITQWTGPLIDRGINFALNGIGCKKYPDDSLDRPLDLNKFHDQISLSTGDTIDANGSWLVEYYINGPVVNLTGTNTTNYTPIQIDVYVMDGIAYQSMMADGIFFYRYANIGSDFTMDWMMIAYPRFENDISTNPAIIQINDKRVSLIDMLYLIVRLNTDPADGALIKINTYAAIPIYTSDGQVFTSGTKKGSIIPLVYNKTENRFYLIGGGGSKWIVESLETKADKAVPPITTNVNTPMTKVTVNAQGIVTKVEQATTADIKHNDQTLEEKLDSISTDITNMGNEGVKFNIDGTVPSAWGTIPTT